MHQNVLLDYCIELDGNKLVEIEQDWDFQELHLRFLDFVANVDVLDVVVDWDEVVVVGDVVVVEDVVWGQYLHIYFVDFVVNVEEGVENDGDEDSFVDDEDGQDEEEWVVVGEHYGDVALDAEVEDDF